MSYEQVRHDELESPRTKTKNLEVTRYSLLFSRTKLWCPECQGLKWVSDYFASPADLKLNCGHRRKMDVVKAAQSVAA
jgi:hypothetical protein